MHVQFKKLSNSKDSAIVLDTIHISGTYNDSILVVNASVTEFLLPLDIHRETTTFVLQRTNPADSTTHSDTLQVGYSMQSKVIAHDCGAFTYYQNLEIVKTSLKDIKAFSASLLTDPTLYVAGSANYQAYAVNYQIFF